MNETYVQKPSGVMQRIYSRVHKKGAILSFDSTNYLLVLIIFIGLGVMGLAGLEGFRIVSAKFEMRDIATAAATYQNLRIDHQPVSDISTLVNKDIIDAANAVDGSKHGQFLKKTERWDGSKMLDPWGNPYKYSNGKVTSEGGINGAMEEVVESGDVNN